MSRAIRIGLLTFVFLLALPGQAETVFDADQWLEQQAETITIAQWEGDDTYDPFADYSEFEETEDEEADINFFRNGRLFTLSLTANYRGYTGNLANLYNAGTGFGLYLTYFFDLRFAALVGYVTGEGSFAITSSNGTLSQTGRIGISQYTFNLKYFFNVQNVNRGLANLSPYMIGGITQFHRTLKIDGDPDSIKDSAVGVDIGFGIEIPILRGQVYFGLQGIYHLVNFADENAEYVIDGDAVNGATGITPNGDIYSLQALLGVNF